jgi:hypothetical protein
MYCGNNLAHKKLMNGQLQLGTRYTCMRKGIGQGKSMPFDNSYLGEYIPIDDTKIYCGNGDILPAGYDRFGSLNQCLSKGIGIGIKKKADDIVKKVSNDRITRYELIQICKELKIKGYSRLTKDMLLNLVLGKISE